MKNTFYTIKTLIVIWNKQKHPPEVFVRNGVLRNFTKFTWKHLCQRLFFNKVADLKPATLLKKRLWHNIFLWILTASEQIFKTNPDSLKPTDFSKHWLPVGFFIGTDLDFFPSWNSNWKWNWSLDWNSLQILLDRFGFSGRL